MSDTLRQLVAKPPFYAPDRPTKAELAALRAYLEAGSIRGAACQLGLAESTVKNQLANVRSRLGARTTAELVLILYEELVA